MCTGVTNRVLLAAWQDKTYTENKRYDWTRRWLESAEERDVRQLNVTFPPNDVDVDAGDPDFGFTVCLTIPMIFNFT